MFLTIFIYPLIILYCPRKTFQESLMEQLETEQTETEHTETEQTETEQTYS